MYIEMEKFSNLSKMSSTSYDYLRSIIPVKLYQSGSNIYMTCISKLPRTTKDPNSNNKKAIEDAFVQALETNLSPGPVAPSEQQLKGDQPVLIRSEIRFKHRKDPNKKEKSDLNILKSQVLLEQYQRLYNDKPKEMSTPCKRNTVGRKDHGGHGNVFKNIFSLILSGLLLLITLYVLIEVGDRNYFL
ncbi:uncharacterized protein LOC115634264 [Scaptodrosophila lebanonensis]|uniref:Uncharacterized protein LOC115634264 n=1 Tax=Drosophila lebanonensis TaxID=7225 RepID=A0A6J2UKJ6_DROLE|nr:uncharacterized protein LOC115634264 [Scaptodrosophila lebanonensis]